MHKYWKFDFAVCTNGLEQIKRYVYIHAAWKFINCQQIGCCKLCHIYANSWTVKQTTTWINSAIQKEAHQRKFFFDRKEIQQNMLLSLIIFHCTFAFAFKL